MVAWSKKANRFKLGDLKTALDRASIIKGAPIMKQNGVLNKALEEYSPLIKDGDGILKKLKGGKDTQRSTKDFFLGFRTIFFSSNRFLTLFVIALLLISALALLLVELWLGFWSVSFFNLTNEEYFSYYLIINISMSGIYIVTQLLFKYMSRQGLMKFYKKVIKELLKKDLNFYSENSVDSLMFRLTRDMMILDNALVSAAEKNLSSIILIIGGIAVLTYVTYGIFFLALLVVVWRFSYLTKINLLSCKSFYDISNRLKSKLQYVLNSILDDIIPLRNFKSTHFYDEKFYKLSDDFQNSASHLGNAATAWLAIKTTLFNWILLSVVYLFVMIFMAANPTYLLNNIFIISFSLNWVIKLRAYLQTGIPNIVQLQTHMYSFHHINEFEIFGSEKELDEEEIEENLHIDPSKFVYELRNVSFSYQGKVRIFNRLNFVVEHGEKVAVMGRSGSGRHSLIQILMKNYEKVEFREEEVFNIFGKDVRKIDPIALRWEVNYLSKEPILFFGTVRKNIDPYEEFSDEQIVDILSKLNFLSVLDSVGKEDNFENRIAQLNPSPSPVKQGVKGGGNEAKKSFELGELLIPNKPEDKQEVVNELSVVNLISNEGENEVDNLLSFITDKIGQKKPSKNIPNPKKIHIAVKQKARILEYLKKKHETVKNKNIIRLILTAKSVLQKFPLLFMEEGCLNFNNSSTANTYKLIWQEMKGTTIVSILSKFLHIFDYDKVAILKDGEIAEFGSPFELLRNPESELIALMGERNPGLLDTVRKKIESMSNMVAI